MKFNYFLISLLTLFASCKNNAENAVEEKTRFTLNSELKSKTEITTVAEQPVVEQLALTGKVDYNKNDLVSFRSLLNGVVEEVKFELGDFVKKGQQLLVVKSNEMINLIQQKRIFQNQEQLLIQQIKTKKELLNDGLATLPEVKQLENDLLQVQVEIQKLTASLALYKAGNEVGTYIVISPKDGYIVQKNISQGQNIETDDQALFAISNLKEVWVMVNIYASNLRYIHEGSPVSVRTIAYPDKYYKGKIDKIYNVFDEDEHVLKARVVLENKNLMLLPGLSADIFVDKNNVSKTAVAIPQKAIIFDDDNYFVVVYKDDKNLEIRKIYPIAKNEKFTYTIDGLQAGEKVISRNALLIYEELNNQ